eukprot:713354-Alexandrium_andersonii.AAC.1
MPSGTGHARRAPTSEVLFQADQMSRPSTRGPRRLTLASAACSGRRRRPPSGAGLTQTREVPMSLLGTTRHLQLASPRPADMPMPGPSPLC